MNRKNLTAAVLAGLAGAAGIASTATAGNGAGPQVGPPMFLNPNGVGEVLLYPYYTVNNGNSTLMSVVNTTDFAKAVKVRFKEGENSREVLDFNLYLSAWDVWSAAVVNDGGTPTLIIPDNSCTVPYLYENDTDGDGAGEQEFLDFDYTGDEDDGGSQDIERAMEGHMEIIEMGEMWNDPDYIGAAFGGNVKSGAYKSRPYGSAEAVTHVADEDGNQVPLDCEMVNDQWSVLGGVAGIWLDVNESVDMASLTGGLFGSASVVNVGEGTLFSYDAKAIAQFHHDGDLHVEPGTPYPNLNSGNSRVAIINADDGGSVLIEYARSIDAMSALFMHDTIMNEYVLGGIAAAESEWVLTFPTKGWYVDLEKWGEETGVTVTTYVMEDPDDIACQVFIDHDNDPNTPDVLGPWVVDADGDGETGSVGSITGIPRPPNCGVDEVETDLFFESDPFTSEFDGEACEQVGFDIWDTNENAAFSPDFDDLPIVSPPPPDPDLPPEVKFELCYETSILRFGDSDIFGSRNYHTVNTTNPGGWARIDFGIDGADKNSDPDHVLPYWDTYYGDAVDLVGLPVTGFWAAKFVNGVLPGGVLSNYGGLFDHKGSVSEGTGQIILPSD